MQDPLESATLSKETPHPWVGFLLDMFQFEEVGMRRHLEKLHPWCVVIFKAPPLVGGFFHGG